MLILRVFLMSLLAGISVRAANEIGFVEQFALAEDRGAALKQLVPGTEDYYFYHALHHQHTGQEAAFNQVIEAWRKRHDGRLPSRAQQLLNRQALLDFETSPQASSDTLIKALNLTFDHQQQIENRKSTLPTKLDAQLVSTTRMVTEAMKDTRSLEKLSDAGLARTAGRALNDAQRRNLLSRLPHPGYPGLAEHVAKDLAAKDSRGFGKMAIHRQLTLAQLDALKALRPELLKDRDFVNHYIRRLRPGDQKDLQRDTVARRESLDTIRAFVKDLDPIHNGLKIAVLYNLLQLDLEEEKVDQQRLLAYVKLPRNAGYLNHDWTQQASFKSYHYKLGGSYGWIRTPGNDQELVTSCLRELFVEAENYDPYRPWMNEMFLKRLFAQTKIEAGVGAVAKLTALITPTAFKALKERVDIDLAPYSQKNYAPEDEVELHAMIKNVRDLTVRVFEIKSFNYFRHLDQELNLGMNLDGLVASETFSHRYDELPERRVKRSFRFPALKKRGVFVIEMIGNGKSSRALIIKGHLHHVEKLTPVGHQFFVFNEANKRLGDASIWIQGHEFTAGKDGSILVPYSGNPRDETMIIRHGTFAARSSFKHLPENYSLTGGLYVDRESLIKGQEAFVLLKPSLLINGVPTSLHLLKNVQLEIKSVSHDGIESRVDVQDFKLFEDRETLHPFRVPKELNKIQFTLRAKVKNGSGNRMDSLEFSANYTLNGIDQTSLMDTVHLTRPEGQYTIELLGKNGEPRAGQVLQCAIHHRFVRDPQTIYLQSDEDGRSHLGALPDIDWFSVRTPDRRSFTFRTAETFNTLPRTLHGVQGSDLVLPFWSDEANPADVMHLFEIRNNGFYQDWSTSLSWSAGLLTLKNLSPGTYGLITGHNASPIEVRVSDGVLKNGFLVSDTQAIGPSSSTPLHLKNIVRKKNFLEITLGHTNAFTRVHVFAQRYRPAYPAFNSFRVIAEQPLAFRRINRPFSFYASGRNIGDEYQYIIDRSRHKKYPGNMLQRPGLLLNPWELGETATDVERLSRGEAAGRAANAPSAPSSMIAPRSPAPKFRPPIDQSPNIDFLAEPTVLLVNLIPDAKGRIRIEHEALKDKTQIQIVVVDPERTQVVEFPLADQPATLQELRMAKSFDVKKHLTQQSLVSIAPAGKEFVIPDIANSSFTTYDSLDKVFTLFQTRSQDTTLPHFEFILRWPDLPPEEKLSTYAEFACHELHLFLYHKDRAFFDEVIAPYLKNKKERTFIDRWLLEEDLSAYTSPWKFNRLNTVERILLGQHLAEFRASIQRQVLEQVEIQPINIAHLAKNYEMAFRYSDLNAAREWEAVDHWVDAKDGERKTELRRLNAGLGNRENFSRSGKIVMDSKNDDVDLAEGRLFEKAPAAGRLFKSRRNREEPGRFYDDFGTVVDGRKRFFQKLDTTKEWAENNYYHLPIGKQLAALIDVNAFWKDYAAHPGQKGFLSTHLAEPTGNFAEMMLALAVLDFPFKASAHQSEVRKGAAVIIPGNALIVFHKEYREQDLDPDRPTLLVSQHFFRADDRYYHKNNERFDKHVTEEFLHHVVYGCQVTMTNPGGNLQNLSVLLQLPQGAMPLSRGFYTKGHPVSLQPYATQSLEYFFYFPNTGNYPQYPVHLAKNETLVAHADPFTFKVVKQLSEVDKDSWPWISQQGSNAQVLEYLEKTNIARLDLEAIAWRMKDRAFFLQTTERLNSHFAFSTTLWSYALKHQHPESLRAYLAHAGLDAGSWIQSPILEIDPVAQHTYQHLEYAPLVHSRAHATGKERRILNHRFRAQYQRFMQALAYKPTLDSRDRLAVTYYLALQDRIAEALTWFDTVEASGLQYDYLKAWLGMFRKQHAEARAIALRYKDYPVPRWQRKFAHVLSQLDEQTAPVNEEDRDQQQVQMAASEPSLDFDVEDRNIRFSFQEVERCQLNFYPMDIELLFSRNPFIQNSSKHFTYTRPSLTREVVFPDDQQQFSYELPPQFHQSNVMIEVQSAAAPVSRSYFANDLKLQIMENYGQLDAGEARVYVKVYARMNSGEVKFFKDGYTDFRGRFDYISLNTNELDNVNRFALLIMSETQGATIREVEPPKR